MTDIIKIQLIFAIKIKVSNSFSLADSCRKQNFNFDADLGGSQDFDPANFDGMLIVCLHVCVHIRILVRTTAIHSSCFLLYKVYHRFNLSHLDVPSQTVDEEVKLMSHVVCSESNQHLASQGNV